MTKKEDYYTKTILKKLAILFPLFYTTYFILAIIFVAAYQLPWEWVPRVVFHHEHFGFFDYGDSIPVMEQYSGLAKASWFSMVIALVLLCAMIFFIVKSTSVAWDYVFTVAFWHLVLSCIVSLSWPINWAWWVTILVGSIVVCVVAELSCYYLHDLREIDVDH